MIAGAQKAGTTSLLRYVAQHPQLCAHAVQEFTFFEDPEHGLGWNWARQRYFYDWTPDQGLVAKYATLPQSKAGLQRLATHSPGCQVVLVLRDPVERAFSSYRMERNHGAVVRPFEYILTRLEADARDMWKSLFLDFGDYPAALRRIYEHFAPQQVTTLLFEDFVRDPVAACHELFRVIRVDPSFDPETSIVHNAHRQVRSQAAASGLRWLRRSSNPIRRSARRLLSPAAFNRVAHSLLEANQGLYSEEEIDPGVRETLGRYYRPLNQKLEKMLGRDLSAWTGMTPERSPAPRAAATAQAATA